MSEKLIKDSDIETCTYILTNFPVYFLVRKLAYSAIERIGSSYIQLKWPWGHLENPNFEQGLQAKPETSYIFERGCERYGDIPNSGIVLPQYESITLLKAAEICISPVSGVIIRLEVWIIDADWFIEYLPQAL